MTFRFDDVCINSDMKLHNQMTEYLLDTFPKCEIIWAISPIVHDSEKESQRVFPKEWNALSLIKTHYALNKMGLPQIHENVKIASHGLIHIDHRLLNYEAQELSIVLSCNLTGAKIFVPPFNKYNQNTELICLGNQIELIKYQEYHLGCPTKITWKSMEYNKWNSNEHLWYLHAREWTMESFNEWFEK